MKKPLLWTLIGVPTALTVALAGLLAFGWAKYGALERDLASARLEHASSTAEFTEKIVGLEGSLALLTDERNSLEEELQKEQKKNSMFENQIKGIAETVGTLDKLSKTDPQLLQKYSKVYFLNEHYEPSELADIDSESLLNKDSTQQFHAKILPRLVEMLDDAKEDGIDLKVVSAYRSFRQQASLKSAYTVTYGTGANRFSADQGYSEHQLGTTVDISTVEVGGPYMGFEKTEAFAWLKENAHKHGFILSYPAGNSYYVYEPWHWRYVGEKLARHLNREEKNFYDLDQREINEYLVSFWD